MKTKHNYQWGKSVLLLLIILFSCSQREPLNKFSDDVLVKIADLQDRRLSDSLYQFLESENPVYRKEAALAFASIQDTSAVDLIGKLLLKDEETEIRANAAFALGQTGSSKAFSFLQRISGYELISDVSEAMGKSVPDKKSGPDNLNSWALYRLALRGLADSTTIKQAANFLSENNDESVRLGAAHFFARGPTEISMAETDLLRAAKSDSSVYVRMAAILALRKIKNESVRQILQEILANGTDYRVRVNAVRALQSFPFDKIKELLYQSLNDENINVGIAASEVIKQAAAKDYSRELVEKARSNSNWRIRANLFEAALAATSDKELAEEICREYDNEKNVYGKAALISALAHSPMSFGFVKEQLMKTNVFVIRSSAASALVGMNRNKLFEAPMKEGFASIYKEALQLNDPAVIGIIASALADSTLGYRPVITDFNFLYDAKNKLSLPGDNEALQPLEAAIAYFEKRKVAPEVKNEFNHPINWGLVKTIPKNQQVLIKTSKGEIVIQLLVEEAPGSVANFVDLVNKDYFDSKNFHRVVPNFVIQGGCNRGDGWGSEDYSIRSEFSRRRYREGSVGMASVGKDTEGTQWFITHSPTPHLDGRYTIFAEVVSGMDVVHRIEVGDQILDVVLIIN